MKINHYQNLEKYDVKNVKFYGKTFYKMKIIIVLRNIGPYHNSRFESLLKSNLKISVFETRPKSKEYLWAK